MCQEGGRPGFAPSFRKRTYVAKSRRAVAEHVSQYVSVCACCSLAEEGVAGNSPVFSSLPLACPPMKRKGCRGHWGELWQTEADSVTESPDGATQMLTMDGTATVTSVPCPRQDERQRLVFRLRSSELCSGWHSLCDDGQVN